MLMETKGNSVNGLDKEEGKNDAGATPLKITLNGQASGFFYTPLNEGDFFNTANFCSQHQISLFWRTSCRFFSKSIPFVISTFYIGRTLMVS